MATVLVPTMRAKYDPNPRGSATAHVTMAAANPFERESVSVRAANQPRDMLPGMGDFWTDFRTGFTGDTSTGSGGATSTGTTAEGGTSSSWGSMFGSIFKPIVDAGVQIGAQALDKELNPAQPTQNLDMNTILAMQLAQNNQTQQIPSSQPAPLPNAGQAHTLPAVNVNMPPQPQPSKPNYMPWVIGGVAVLAVGGFFMMKRRRR
jgi:hypothetical protein